MPYRMNHLLLSNIDLVFSSISINAVLAIVIALDSTEGGISAKE